MRITRFSRTHNHSILRNKLTQWIEHWSRDNATMITSIKSVRSLVHRPSLSGVRRAQICSQSSTVDKCTTRLRRYFRPSTNMPTTIQTQLAPNNQTRYETSISFYCWFLRVSSICSLSPNTGVHILSKILCKRGTWTSQAITTIDRIYSPSMANGGGGTGNTWLTTPSNLLHRQCVQIMEPLLSSSLLKYLS